MVPLLLTKWFCISSYLKWFFIAVRLPVLRETQYTSEPPSQADPGWNFGRHGIHSVRSRGDLLEGMQSNYILMQCLRKIQVLYRVQFSTPSINIS